MDKKDVPTGRGISIQQPFVEQILQGKKNYEYRSRPTKIRGRVYLYASLTPGHISRWKGTGFEPGELATGLIVGSVEIIDCKWFPKLNCYGYELANPKRYKAPIKPENRAQPCWFYPFV
ncbi:hypothetical protein DOM21_14990 [Bacteriovorax stolpii]|uniref:ASCH domain-containing protein n=1 Tax=Bacteriovorax stolpii TaxID=960 RepID=UPI0011584C83|nr:ASCH domain-containing protein [Bacteriovorax stolpii]QDK42732.1 hypothetical protein DOM21_14990 [Bacteriovorax stolpii]